MASQQPRFLFIDSYDSFTFNLAALCKLAIPGCTIHIIKNDALTLQEILLRLGHFSAIIIGPGPGSPDNPHDIGVIRDLWNISDEHLLPIFGVCLGLQSMAIAFGAQLKRLHTVKHGQLSNIHHTGTDLFEGAGNVEAVRYHSLHVELQEEGAVDVLAWADDGQAENGRVVMATKHRTRPYWAVQYHPESVCTEGGGAEVLANFWRLAQAWNKKIGRQIRPWDSAAQESIGHAWPYFHPRSDPATPSQPQSTVTASIVELPDLSVTDVCECLGALDEVSPFVLLDSAAKPGRFSIVGSLTPATPQITYYTCDNFVTLTRGKHQVQENLGSYDVWSWLSAFMRPRKAGGGCPEIPFWGGLVGHLSYELGVHSLSVPLRPTMDSNKRHPDVNLVFVERSVVLDSGTGKVHIQSLIPDDHTWIANTTKNLLEIAKRSVTTEISDVAVGTASSPEAITLPDKARYISRIHRAKEHLFAGDSYEICLTAQTRINISECSPSSVSSSWKRYKSLRKSNPAPHSAYFRLHPTTLLSSSPERFLSFSRPPGTVCQLRPIKGTIRKAPGITRAVAEKALSGSVKEVAENLMIVDLIRHDLHGVVGEDVQVKQFCSVEEYETVWQLVSVIEGKDAGTNLDPNSELGWEMLQKSLPPGSMTGAPKKRSVEILQSLEDHDRNIYSGVFGYWCVGGGGDWSVTIRSCFKYNPMGASTVPMPHGDGQPHTQTEEWVIGAGGAITALSDAEAEWDEMVVKLHSVLRAFGALPAV